MKQYNQIFFERKHNYNDAAVTAVSVLLLLDVVSRNIQYKAYFEFNLKIRFFSSAAEVVVSVQRKIIFFIDNFKQFVFCGPS